MKRNIKKVIRKMKTREAMDKRLAKKGKNQPTKEEDHNMCFYGFEDYSYED